MLPTLERNYVIYALVLNDAYTWWVWVRWKYHHGEQQYFRCRDI